jgi:hypothetical protein
MPVRNIAPVTVAYKKQVMMRKFPIFLPVGPGADPMAALIDRTMGKMTPPARAVTEGMAGAMIKSLTPKA